MTSKGYPLTLDVMGHIRAKLVFPVVGSRTQNQGGSMSSLFPTGIRCKA